MPTSNHAMPLAARRVFRTSLVVALSLAIAYGLAMPLPYIAPIIALYLNLKPSPPPGVRALLGLILVVMITLGTGLIITPILQKYPVSGLLIIAVGLYFSMYITLIHGKQLVGTLLTVGLTMIPAAGTVHSSLALIVVVALVASITVSVICQWIVYPFFPEDRVDTAPAKPASSTNSNWAAMRATLIVLPPFILTLTNPMNYLPLIMKSVMLGQQGSLINARLAGRELLGSTLLAGCFAFLFWFMLDLYTTLLMFFCWMLVFSIYFVAKIYNVLLTAYPASFWLNTAITMIIIIGPAVQSSNSSSDVYKDFLLRISLFIGVSIYAWLAIFLLEQFRGRQKNRKIIKMNRDMQHAG